MTISTRSIVCFLGGVLALATPASTVVAQVAPPPRQAPARDTTLFPSGTATLAGRVVAADDSARPMRRALVRVSGRELPAGRILLSDQEGRFVFTGLPASAYTIVATKPGWVGGYYGATEVWKGPGTPVVLADGEQLTDLDVRMAPGGVITGRIFNQFGQPQAGARVLPLERRRVGGRDTYTRARTSTSLSETTDDRGEYRIYGLPPGEFIIGANISGSSRSTTTLTTPEEVRWAEQAARSGLLGAGAAPPPGPRVGYSPAYFPGVSDPSAATPIQLSLGEERTGADFQLQFVPTATVSGTVTMPNGEPTRGIQLLLTSAAGMDITMSLLSVLLLNRASIGRDGQFSFESVAPGDYFLLARGSSQPAPARGRGPGPRTQPVMDLWASENVTVNGVNIDGISLRMQPGLTLSGRVEFDGITLEPPPDRSVVSLRLAPADPQAVSVGGALPEVNADGTFTIKGVAPGEYLLTAGVPRLGGPSDVGWLALRATVDGRNALRVPFEVRPGGDVGGIVVEFTDRPARLSGQVTDAGGRPVQGLTLVLFPADPDVRSSAAGTRARRTAQLNSDGRYDMPLLLPGDYLLAALADVSQADLTDPAYLDELADSAIPITLALGDEKVQDIGIGR